MNQKSYIKLGNKVFNLLAIHYIEFDEKNRTVTIKVDTVENKYKFDDDKEFERFQKYSNLFSTEFFEASPVENNDSSKNKEILI